MKNLWINVNGLDVTLLEPFLQFADDKGFDDRGKSRYILSIMSGAKYDLFDPF